MIDRPDRPDRHPGMISIVIDGRPVPGRVPSPGSPAAAYGDMAFMLCGSACERALCDAIRRDRHLRLVH